MNQRHIIENQHEEPVCSRACCVLLGLSGLLIFFAWDANFNMQVVFPLFVIFCYIYFSKSKGFSNISDFRLIVFVLGAMSLSLIYNLLVNTEIINARSIIRFFYTIEILFYAYFVINMTYAKKEMRLLLHLNVFCGVMIALNVIFFFLLGDDGKIGPRNIWGVEVEENYSGSLLAFYFMINMMMIRYTKNPIIKLIFILAGAIIAFAVALTGCRAAFLGISIGLVLFLGQILFSSKISFLSKGLIIGIVAALCFMVISNAATIFPEFIYKRLFTFSYVDSSNEGRLEIWKYGVLGFLNNPFFGYGVGNFSAYIFADLNLPSGSIIVAHNTYLDALLDLGIIGLIPLSIFVGNNFQGVLRSKILIPVLGCLAFTALIVGGERTFFLWNGIIVISLLCKFYRREGRDSLEGLFNVT